MYKPFAIEIYRRFKKGESVQQLAERLGIPADRIEKRINAAAVHLRHLKMRAA